MRSPGPPVGNGLYRPPDPSVNIPHPPIPLSIIPALGLKSIPGAGVPFALSRVEEPAPAKAGGRPNGTGWCPLSVIYRLLMLRPLEICAGAPSPTNTPPQPTTSHTPHCHSDAPQGISSAYRKNTLFPAPQSVHPYPWCGAAHPERSVEGSSGGWFSSR